MTREPCLCKCGNYPKNPNSKYCQGHYYKTQEGKNIQRKRADIINAIPKKKEQQIKMMKENNPNYFPGVRDKIVKAKKEFYKDSEQRAKQSGRQEKFYKTHPEARLRKSESKKKYYKEHPELRNTLSLSITNSYTPKLREMRRQAMGNQLSALPNKLETKLLDIFRFNNFPIRYTGDFSFWLTLKNGIYKNPDFKVTHKKGIIEFFGTYWHSKAITGTDEKEHHELCVKNYKEIGYNCLIIWENELDDKDALISKVKSWLLNLSSYN